MFQEMAVAALWHVGCAEINSLVKVRVILDRPPNDPARSEGWALHRLFSIFDLVNY